MSARQATITLLFVVAAVLLAWDVIAVLNSEPNDTISSVVLGWSWRCQSLPFGAGVIGGHLFWPSSQRRDRQTAKHETIALVIVCALVIMMDVAIIGILVPVVPFIAGGVIGHLLWAQGPKHPASELRWK